MKTGDVVRIYVHGEPTTVAEANVVLVSHNQLSVALDFAEPPSFCRRILRDTNGVVGVNIDTGRVTMLLQRIELDGKPWGPWIEVSGGGHYEIEEGHGTVHRMGTCWGPTGTSKGT
jgi:hypothetical protein